ncbi:MAG TPA: glycosyltransferase [Verrucomicrobiae bacterium]|nr:glycosyltransferase [Verrucomicrobiae bacterium]
MIRKKILVIAPYPIASPRHGGQKRTKALVDNYRTFVRDVKFVAVFHKASYPDFEAEDIPLGQIENLNLIDKKPYAMDQIIGKAINNDTHVRSQFAKVLQEYAPDIIHVEQSFLYEGLSVLLNELNLHPFLIFGSQNIEHTMKAAIYEGQVIPEKEKQELIEETRRVEERFSKEADLVVAVSASDADELRKMGAKTLVIAPNGIETTHPTSESLAYWNDFKRREGVRQMIGFVGSGHPPNYTGFLDVVGEDTRFLPDDAKIVMAGGVSEYFKATYSYNTPKKHAKLWAGIIPVGFLDEDILTGFIASCDVIILPITSGGGSNLKTAEALLSGKKIVATDYAFRGFEAYQKLPNVRRANEKSDFQETLKEALKAGVIERSAQETALVQHVSWEYCLKALRTGLRKGLRPTVSDAVGISRKYAGKAVRRLKRLL